MQKSRFSSGPCHSLLLQVFTDSTNFPTIHRFYNTCNLSSFCINRSSCRGPLKPFFYRFSLAPRNLQFFADFTIFAILAVFAKFAVLIGHPQLLLVQVFTDSTKSTIFGRSYNIMNFHKQSKFLSGPSQALLQQVFTDSTSLPIFPTFQNISNFREFCKNRSSRRGPLNFFF